MNEQDRPFEYMMNRLRLFSSFKLDEFQQRTGLPASKVLTSLQQAQQQGLVCSQHNQQHWQVTTMGYRYLNDLLSYFL